MTQGGGGATTLIGVTTFFVADAFVLVLVVEVVFAADVEAQITSDPPEILEPTLTDPALLEDEQAAWAD